MVNSGGRRAFKRTRAAAREVRMHEASLALAVLDIVKQEAERHHVGRITMIRLAVGPFTGLEWETFTSFFSMAAEGTVAAGAQLEHESAPADAECRDCNTTFAMHHIRDRCPNCGGNELDCMGGRMFAITGLDAAS